MVRNAYGQGRVNFKKKGGVTGGEKHRSQKKTSRGEGKTTLASAKNWGYKGAGGEISGGKKAVALARPRKQEGVRTLLRESTRGKEGNLRAWSQHNFGNSRENMS